MRVKPLGDIKYGPRVVDALEHGNLYFVEDIRRATGFDDKTLRTVLSQLLKHKHIEKNGRGQWTLPQEN